MAGFGHDRRIHFWLSAQFFDAPGDATCVLLFLLSIFKKFFGHRSRMNPRSGNVMKPVAQHAHDLRSECLVKNVDGLSPIELVILRDGALFHIPSRPGPDFLDIFHETHWFTSCQNFLRQRNSFRAGGFAPPNSLRKLCKRYATMGECIWSLQTTTARMPREIRLCWCISELCVSSLRRSKSIFS